MMLKISIEWLNQNSGAVMALLTFFYVIATIALYISSHKSICIAKQLHRDIHRPVVVCDFVIIRGMMYFRIRNIGPVSACNLRIDHEEVNTYKDNTPLVDDTKQKAKEFFELPGFKNGISFFSPGQEFHYLYHIFTMDDKAEFPTFRFTMKYSDPSGGTYCDQSEIDLSIYEKAAHSLDPFDRIDRRLDNICSAIKDLNR
jgi:hypothetical protein